MKFPDIIGRFKEFRKNRILGLLYRTVELNKTVYIEIYTHSLLPAAVKLSLFGMMYLAAWAYAGLAGYVMEEIFGFFRLSEIYNFTFPDSVFFFLLARYIIHAIFLFYGSLLVYSVLPAVFSLLVVYPGQKKLYYIRNTIFDRKLYIIEIPDIRITILHQNIIERMMYFGTVEVRDNHGSTLHLESITGPRKLVATLEELKKKR